MSIKSKQVINKYYIMLECDKCLGYDDRVEQGQGQWGLSVLGCSVIINRAMREAGLIKRVSEDWAKA